MLYRCADCDAPLFDEAAEVDAGTGFPSFHSARAPECLAIVERRSHGQFRRQVCCAACDAHLGHRFDDDAQPTGVRYCIAQGVLAAGA